MSTRHRNDGLRKICACSRRQWSRCKHPWHISYKHGDVHYRGSLKRLLGRDVESREDAKAELDKIRTVIRNEQPRDTDELRMLLRGVSPRVALSKAEDITLEAFGERYVERVSKVREKSKSWRDDESMVRQLSCFVLDDGQRLGDKPLATITGDDLELFVQHLRQAGRAASTRNHYIQLITAMFRWATKKGYLGRSPITRDTRETGLKRSKIARRHRRLEGDEEARLLTAAPPRLQRLIVAAIESGCRLGELLALTWSDVSLERGWIHVRAEHAKSGKPRGIPISSRLRSVLQMAQHDPGGRLFGPHHHPFGNEIGERVASPKKMWETAVLKAHGHAPKWVNGSLAPSSSATYRRIDLHFHDLRHEAGSRWLEAGMSLHYARDLLGHASIETTNTYLNATRHKLKEAMAQVDEIRCKDVASSEDLERRLTRNETQEDDGNSLIH